MQYQKIYSGDTVIEFHNNWLGEETVIVNGQVVSKKSSVWGTNHYFSVVEEGRNSRYILTTKVNEALQVMLDLSKNGEPIERDLHVPFRSRLLKKQNNAKKYGLMKLKEYALEEALNELEEALKIDPKDPEIFFHMACAHSVLENTKEGYECIQKAVHFNLQNQEMIFTHDMLAYLRINDAFEGFVQSGFRKYDESLFHSNHQNSVDQ